MHLRLPSRRLLAWALLALPLWASAQSPAFAPAETIRVTRYGDDGSEGTLRWAIERNNQNPGHYRIELSALGDGPHVIKPERELPAILGPVIIENVDWARNGTFVAIDGSAYVVGDGARACPGAGPGQYGTNVRSTTNPGLVLRDTQGVEIRGLEVRNFCIGILLNRTSGSLITDNRIVGNKGGAGIMLTGDDGQGNSTATTTVHNKIQRNRFIDNGDAMELTRGAAFNLIADNFITTDPTLNDEPSQGLEILWGNDNLVLRNHFEHYSDGVQLNWGNRNYIAANTFTGLSSAVTLSGTDNIVDGNLMYGNRVAVSVRPQGEPGVNRISGPARNRITANRMWDNGQAIDRCFAGGACLPEHKGAIVFGVPGLEHGIFKGNRGGGVESDPALLENICGAEVTEHCQPMPNHGQAAPTLLAVEPSGQGVTISGTLRGQPNTLYRVELFANSDPAGQEAEHYLGFIPVPVDADGQGRFVFPVPPGAAADAANFTATATTVDGATSPLSQPLAHAR